jgi:ketosteroid isomerase-like protein
VPVIRPGHELWDAELRFAEATAKRGVDGWIEWFAADGVVVRRGRVVRGKTEIRELLAPMLNDPAVSLVWSPVHGEVSASGDLGYVYGSWKIAVDDEEQTDLHGMYMTAWRREADGWKVVADIGDVNPGPRESLV